MFTNVPIIFPSAHPVIESLLIFISLCAFDVGVEAIEFTFELLDSFLVVLDLLLSPHQQLVLPFNQHLQLLNLLL